MMRACRSNIPLVLTLLLIGPAQDVAGKCNRYWDIRLRSNGTHWDVSHLNDTLHLSPGDTLVFHEVMLGECPPFFVTHIWNGDTIPLGALTTFNISGLGHHLIIEEHPLEPVSTIASFVVAPISPLPRPCRVHLRALLGGALDPDPGQCCIMRDDLREAGLLPLVEPYSALGFTLTQGAGLSADPQAFADQVNHYFDIVDWVLLELRDPNDASIILHSMPGLITRIGSLRCPTTLNSWLTFNVPPGQYLLAIRHRNHLGIMSEAPIPLGDHFLNVNMSSSGVPLWGNGSFFPLPMAQRALWPGNAKLSSAPQQIKFAGSINDRDAVLARIGGAIPTSTTVGYWTEDTNLDGVVKYAGPDNDLEVILQTIGGSTPTSVRVEQIPD